MDSALRPREIQARIRAGQSPEEVAEVAGIPVERVGVFAGPVLAEREHVAQQAMAATVRRRGETSGHRNLGSTLTDRLASRSIDDDTLTWDSAKMDDGRWSVTATYDSGEAQRQAIFYYDVKARFSVAANDDARWVLGEQTMARSGAGDALDDNEPTVDLSDELALVRATQDRDDAAEVADEDSGDGEARVQELHLVQDEWDAKEAAAYAELQGEETASETETDQADGDADGADSDGAGADAVETSDSDSDETAAPAAEVAAEAAGEDDPDESADESGDSGSGDLDRLYEMLGGDGYAEDSTRVYSGLSDASAVPDTDNSGWEPAIVMNVPVEPGPDDEEEHLFSDQPEVAGPPRVEADADAGSAASAGSPDSPTDTEAEPVGDDASGGSRRSRRRRRGRNKKAAASAASPAIDEPVDQPLPLDTAPESATTAGRDDDASEAPLTAQAEESDQSVHEVSEPAQDTEPESPAGDASAEQPEPEAAESSLQGETTPAPDRPTTDDPTPEQATPEQAPKTEAPPEGGDAAAQPEGGDAAAQEDEPKPKPKKSSKRKRASVPSWDEIMFGGPPRNSG